MKKVLSLLMILIIAFSLVACSEVESIMPVESVATEPSTEVTKSKFEEVTIFEDDNIVFKIKGLEYDKVIDSYKIKVYMENNTDTDVMFYWSDVSVNGFMVDAYFSSKVIAGKKEHADVLLLGYYLEEQGISNVEEVEFVLEAYETSESIFKGEIYCEKAFAVSFK